MNLAICLICLTSKPMTECEFVRAADWARERLVCVDCAMKLGAEGESEECWEHA